MKVKELENGWREIYIENIDDLWYVKNIIDENAVISATVMRREEKSEDMERSKATQRKPIAVNVRPEEIFFQPFTNYLRIQGTIISGPEGTESQHQAIQVSERESIKIYRNDWESLSGKILKEAMLKTSSNAIFIVMDDEEAIIAEIHEYGLREVMKIISGKSGKEYTSNYKKQDYFSEIRKGIKSIKYRGPLIITGPGFEGNNFLQFLKENEIENISPYNIPSTREDNEAVYEIISTEEVKRILGDSKLSKEREFMDKFLEGLSKNRWVSYGVTKIVESSEMGAIQSLMVLEEKIREKEISHIMEKVWDSSGDIIICAKSSEYYHTLLGFGGIIALLRYNVQ